MGIEGGAGRQDVQHIIVIQMKNIPRKPTILHDLIQIPSS